MKVIDGTALGRGTITDLIFSVTVARPFAPGTD